MPSSTSPASFETRLLAELPRLEAFLARDFGRRLRRRESVSDLVQSLVGDLLADDRLSPPEDPEAFRRYLRQCARNKVLRKCEYHTALKRDPGREQHEGESGEQIFARLVGKGTTPSRDMMRGEEVAQLQAALQTLPASYREAVQRNRIDGVPSVEIARQTGRSPGAVRNQVYRGLAKLAEQILSESSD